MAKPRENEEAPRDRQEPLDPATPVIVGSVDEGAEVSKSAVVPTPADDYTANATQEGASVGEDDFRDEQDVADRPDTSVMIAEEADETEDEGG